MGLLPLEFTDGLTDSPYYRDKLATHERELDRMNQAIKNLIKEVKDLLTAAKGESCKQVDTSGGRRSLRNHSLVCRTSNRSSFDHI